MSYVSWEIHTRHVATLGCNCHTACSWRWFWRVVFRSGNVAVRNTELGSWFVRFFVYVCSTESHYNDLQSMMNKVLIIINSWFSAPPTARTTTHYTVQFNSAISELATVSSLEPECFKGTPEDWRGTRQPELCWQSVQCSGVGNRKTPSRCISDWSWEWRSRRLTRREQSIVVGHQWLQSACQSSRMTLIQSINVINTFHPGHVFNVFISVIFPRL